MKLSRSLVAAEASLAGPRLLDGPVALPPGKLPNMPPRILLMSLVAIDEPVREGGNIGRPIASCRNHRSKKDSSPAPANGYAGCSWGDKGEAGAEERSNELTM